MTEKKRPIDASYDNDVLPSAKTQKTVNLREFVETRYVALNKDLQRIFNQLENGILNQDALQIIEPMIRENKWQEFDEYCTDNGGIGKFWETLQCLFFLHYFAAVKIDYVQMQNAMGIQQARWSVDPENSFNNFLISKQKEHQGQYSAFFLKKINEFTYFQNIDEKNKKSIALQFYDIIGGKKVFNFDAIYDSMQQEINRISKDMELAGKSEPEIFDVIYPLIEKRDLKYKNIKEEMSKHLHNRLFYEVSLSDFLEKRDKSFYFGGNNGKYYLGIPQTYDVSSLTCFHQPILVFGNLSPKTMVNFILKENRRPYAAHLPGSKSNLEQFDAYYGNLVLNWRHDLFHQTFGKECSVESTIERGMSLCKDQIKEYGNLPGADDGPDQWFQNKAFQTCIETRADHKNKLNDPASQYTGEAFTDEGSIFQRYVRRQNAMSGGKVKLSKRKKQFRKRNTKKKLRKCIRHRQIRYKLI